MTDKKLTSTEAFIKAQSEMNAPSLSKVNPFFKSNYADLLEIKKCTMPALIANDFAYKQTFGFEGEHWGLFGRVVYRDGTIESESFYPINHKLKAQDKGSEITYGRRYVMAAACGVVADDDDDGNMAQKAEPETKWHGPLKKTKLKEEVRKYSFQLNKATTTEALKILIDDYSDVLKQVRLDDPITLDGDGKDHKGLAAEYKAKFNSLKQIEQQLKQPE